MWCYFGRDRLTSKSKPHAVRNTLKKRKTDRPLTTTLANFANFAISAILVSASAKFELSGSRTPGGYSTLTELPSFQIIDDRNPPGLQAAVSDHDNRHDHDDDH